MENNNEVAKSIPRTKEELEEIKSGINQNDVEKILEKTYKRNEKVSLCRKIVRMFESDEFKYFWKSAHDEMKELLDTSPMHIKGNPFEKLERLSTIQGGLEMLESQEVQMEIIKTTAKGEIVNTEELEEKVRIINNNK